jgi:hypothetical protein
MGEGERMSTAWFAVRLLILPVTLAWALFWVALMLPVATLAWTVNGHQMYLRVTFPAFPKEIA